MRRRAAFYLGIIGAFFWPLSCSFVCTRLPYPAKNLQDRTIQRFLAYRYQSTYDVNHYSEDNEHSSQQKDAERRTDDLLQHSHVGAWDLATFHTVGQVMNIWARCPGRKSALNLERLLRRVVEEKMAGNDHVDSVDMLAMYNILVHSWARSRMNGAPERVEEIFDTMLRLYEDNEIDFQPDICTFNGVLLAYASSRGKDAPKEAMRVLHKLHDLRNEGRTDILPNTDSYSIILRAFAASEGPNAPALVLQMIRNMEQFSSKYPAVKPDCKCHNVYLNSLLSLMTIEGGNNSNVAEQMEDHLQEMLTSKDKDVWPSIWSWNMVISAWSKSGSARTMAERGEALFAQLEKYHEMCGHSADTEPITHTYNCLIACYSRSNLPDKAERAQAVLDKMKDLHLNHGKLNQRPDTVTYNSVMNCYGKARDKDAPQKVEGLLLELYNNYEETGDSTVKPSSRSFNTCLDAWAKSNQPEAANMIMAWIHRMQACYDAGNSTVAPNKFTYNAYLEALAKGRRPSICDEAEQVLETMEEQARKGQHHHLKPDVLTFTNVIHCLAVSGADDACERAYKILLRMEDLHSSGYGDVRPNAYTYNCVINAVAKSNLLGKSKIAAKLLQRMKSVSIRPLTITYNNILNACAFSDPLVEARQEVLDIAMIMLKEVQESCGANFITYGTALRVIGIFEDDSVAKWRLARDTFRKCCSDGQLNKLVMNQLKFAVGPGQYSLLRQEAIDEKTGDLRREYTRIAKHGIP